MLLNHFHRFYLLIQYIQIWYKKQSIKAYFKFENRYQVVKYLNFKFEPIKFTSVVPQRSYLEWLLYIIYVKRNDVNNVIKNSKSIMYIDNQYIYIYKR